MSRALPLLLTACVPGPTLPSPSVTEEPAMVTTVPAVKNNALSSLQVEGPEESFAGKTANTLNAARIAELDRVHRGGTRDGERAGRLGSAGTRR